MGMYDLNARQNAHAARGDVGMARVHNIGASDQRIYNQLVVHCSGI